MCCFRPDLDPSRPQDLKFQFPEPARQLLLAQLPALAQEQQVLLQLAADQGLPSGQQAMKPELEPSAAAATAANEGGGQQGQEVDSSSSSSSSKAARRQGATGSPLSISSRKGEGMGLLVLPAKNMAVAELHSNAGSNCSHAVLYRWFQTPTHLACR
jgi:hypothetical protein